MPRYVEMQKMQDLDVESVLRQVKEARDIFILLSLLFYVKDGQPVYWIKRVKLKYVKLKKMQNRSLYKIVAKQKGTSKK